MFAFLREVHKWILSLSAACISSSCLGNSVSACNESSWHDLGNNVGVRSGSTDLTEEECDFSLCKSYRGKFKSMLNKISITK
jgi:hypothetical protein